MNDIKRDDIMAHVAKGRVMRAAASGRALRCFGRWLRRLPWAGIGLAVIAIGAGAVWMASNH